MEKKRLEALEKKRERDALLAEEAEKEKGKQVRDPFYMSMHLKR